jgi:hypothetical protein
MVKKQGGLKSDFEGPPNSKIKLTVTVDDKLLNEMKRIHADEIREAEESDRVPPDWSNTVEMLLRKGVKTYRIKPVSASNVR